MRPVYRFCTLAILATFIFSGCDEIGFRKLDVNARNKASMQSARDVMEQIKIGLRSYFEEKHHYPAGTEAYLYDSIRSFMSPPIDAIYLYRNDNGKGSFIAIGNRASRIVYRYPAIIGAGDYTLYWTGLNGIDEEGEGDDIDATQVGDVQPRFERHRFIDLEGDGHEDKLILRTTGSDVYKDSVRFEIHNQDSLLYSETWPQSSYFRQRPELSDAERRRLVHAELDRFFSPSAFLAADSLIQHQMGKPAELAAKSQEYSDLMHSSETVFNYYTGADGSKGIAWIPGRKKFAVVWKQ